MRDKFKAGYKFKCYRLDIEAATLGGYKLPKITAVHSQLFNTKIITLLSHKYSNVTLFRNCTIAFKAIYFSSIIF